MPPPIDPRAFRDACSRFVTGVCVVTSFGADGPSGMTANAVASLSLEPPLMIVCFDRSARTLEAVEHSGRLAIQFLAHDQGPVARRFASKLPEAEKFEHVEWSDREGVPVLEGCLAGVGCRVQTLVEGGDHRFAIAEAMDLWTSEGDPLVFFRGDYWSLTEREPAPPEVDEALEGP
jgi:3-hydroxy-9,10-secoandrosta-1,3,5(10)-triene-9,17-dione monooxygenase reductase component